jgi:hypothetical protein
MRRVVSIVLPASGQRWSHAFRWIICLAIFGVLAGLLPGGAAAQDLPKYEVTGFRDVRFGMSEQDVRAAVTKTLGVKAADIFAAANTLEGTNVLTVRVPSLDPGPGFARVAYIFGYTSKKLIQVNVIWGEDAPAQTTDAIVGAGSRLQRYFSDFVWKKDATRAGIPVGDNTVVLFAGDDEKKGSVRLIIDGVKYQTVREGNPTPTTSPEPKGPPKLVINYIADRDNPDVAKIERGKF